MFSGIVEQTGIVEKITTENLVKKITVKAQFKDLKLGESISVNGVCLTLVEYNVELNSESISFEVVQETLNITDLGSLKIGSIVNLERSLKVGSDISGHFVSGHVDCLIQTVKIEPEGDSFRVTFKIADEYKKFVTKKGSVCISGISLTVADKSDNEFSVAIIPHTWKMTNLSSIKVGDLLNFEADLFARYILNVLDNYINV